MEALLRDVPIDIDTDALVQAMQFAYVCGTCLWDFLLPGPPKHIKNTARIFLKLLAWFKGLKNRDDDLERECVEYIEEYLRRAYEVQFGFRTEGCALRALSQAIPGLFERLGECGIELYAFYVFLHHGEFYMIDVWRQQSQMLWELLITFDKLRFDTTKLARIVEVLSRGTLC